MTHPDLQRRELARQADALLEDIDETWTWLDDDPSVAWQDTGEESMHGKMADLILESGWERCYHRGGSPRFHYNVKAHTDYRAYRDAVNAIEEAREGFDPDAFEGYVNAAHEWELECQWDDAPYQLALWATDDDSDPGRNLPNVYACGNGGWLNIPSWETIYNAPKMVRVADYLEAQVRYYRSAEYVAYLIDEALTRYDEDRLAGLASHRPERVEA